MDDRILQLALELRELAQEGLFEGGDARYKRILVIADRMKAYAAVVKPREEEREGSAILPENTVVKSREEEREGSAILPENTVVKPREEEREGSVIPHENTIVKTREDLSNLYMEITHKLAQEYFRIFYVDIRTDRYLEYDPFLADAAFDADREESDFFMKSTDAVFDSLYHEDVNSFVSGFSKENVIQSIEDHGEFSLIYRVLHQGSPFFVNMKGTKLSDDPHHIIVGVKNIDADVKREKDYLIKLAQAKDEANRDELTGIRNKHAYAEYIAVTEKQIECGELTTFAMIVFDVNGLKAVNDVLGHQAGDRFIREACGIICNIFKHSPVFRIGGDEFVAFLKGTDYVNIDFLMEQFNSGNRKNAASGGIVIAAGVAKYNGNESIREVFERADAAMYKEKKRLKGR